MNYSTKERRTEPLDRREKDGTMKDYELERQKNCNTKTDRRKEDY